MYLYFLKSQSLDVRVTVIMSPIPIRTGEGSNPELQSRCPENQRGDTECFNDAIFAVSLCALSFNWTRGHVPHIIQERDNDVERPRAPIMSGCTSHTVMDGTPAPG
jgi:hypothetical protein